MASTDDSVIVSRHAQGNTCSVVYVSPRGMSTAARAGSEGRRRTLDRQYSLSRASSSQGFGKYRRSASEDSSSRTFYKALHEDRLNAIAAWRKRETEQQRAAALAALPKIVQL
eukprot:TRINITY_DN122277_c0_g1_i1.p1 TRINITY_DN122277_c0_g1~~TRINITY_DN122277_c0_g1_i1.p1  ORF type:complete len:113 (+),score=16.13 TRINITY_DN122277_c0_g1_i1:351-689(+)